MKIEYIQRMLIDKLIELESIYPSDFITSMKEYILGEDDIEKLKELDGFATDGIYLEYFKENIQKKIGLHSPSILELKNYIKNNGGDRVDGEDVSVSKVEDENNIPSRDGILNRVSRNRVTGNVYRG